MNAERSYTISTFTPAGRPDSISLQFCFYAADNVQRIGTLAHHDDPGDVLARTVPVRGTATHFGTQRHYAHIAHAYYRALALSGHRNIFQVGCGPEVSAAPNHVLRAGKLEQSSARLAVALFHSLDHLRHRDAKRAQFEGVYHHLILRLKAADRRHLGHSRNSSQVIANVPVLRGAQLSCVVVTRRIGEDILEYPAESVCVGSKFEFYTRGQALRGAGELFLDACSRPISIRAILKDHIDPGVAVVGYSAHSPDARQAHHARDQRIGDLVFYDSGASIPARKYDDLAISGVGKRVARQIKALQTPSVAAAKTTPATTAR